MNDLIPRETIAGWQKLKTLVLDSVSSPITKNVYNMALDEFMVWFQQEPRSGFSKATVSAHDLRWTWARLCHSVGGELEQIQLASPARLHPNDRTLSGAASSAFTARLMIASASNRKAEFGRCVRIADDRPTAPKCRERPCSSH